MAEKAGKKRKEKRKKQGTVKEDKEKGRNSEKSNE